MTHAEIEEVHARAMAILRKWGVKRGTCTCYHPADTGENSHAPDCGGVLADDAAYEAAWDRALDEIDEEREAAERRATALDARAESTDE